MKHNQPLRLAYRLPL